MDLDLTVHVGVLEVVDHPELVPLAGDVARPVEQTGPTGLAACIYGQHVLLGEHVRYSINILFEEAHLEAVENRVNVRGRVRILLRKVYGANGSTASLHICR